MYQMLRLAESLVEELGDINWFREHYTRCREFHGIHISIEMALEQQGLLEEFERRLAAVPDSVAK